MKATIFLRKAIVLFTALSVTAAIAGCGSTTEEYSYYGDYTSGDSESEGDSGREIGTAGGLISSAGNMGATDADGTIKDSVEIDSVGMGQSSDIPMPKRDLKDKTIYVFSWRDPNKTDFAEATQVAKDELGMTVKYISTTHETYWNDLTNMVASGKQVDLIDLENDFYPRAITSGLVQPLDKYIDFNTELWADFAAIINKYAYNDHIYFGIQNIMLSGLIYYNPRVFKESGLKTPREYWEEDNWTLQNMVELAGKLTKKDKAGNVTRTGLIPSGDMVAAIAGVDIVEPNRQSNYKLNLKNSRIAKVMNSLYNMGINGNNSAAVLDPRKLLTNEAGLVMTAPWAGTNELSELHDKKQLEWCIYPKLDSDSDYYYSIAAYPRWGLVDGAKNPEGAAAYIEINKWTYLGQPWIDDLPWPETAYTKKYNKTSSSKFTKDEISYTSSLLSKDYPMVITNFSTSYMGTDGFPGMTDVINGSDWSSVLAKREPEIKAIIDAYFK